MAQTRQHIYGRERRVRHGAGPREDGVRLTREGIESFLRACETEGRVEGTLKWYRRGLLRLYEDLPEDKTIRYGTLERWREELVRAGYAASTINSFLSVNNAYLDYVGRREYQLANQLKQEREAQPELTREEYLRLLRTARALGREKEYLLVKVFGTTGVTVQELERVTVEAARAGEVAVPAGRKREAVCIPEGLRGELLGYAERNGYLRGPIFRTREGTAMSRTYVSTVIRQLCGAAGVPEEKGNPRCLKRLYQRTRGELEADIALLVEQAHKRLLEREQSEIGWEER